MTTAATYLTFLGWQHGSFKKHGMEIAKIACKTWDMSDTYNYSQLPFSYSSSAFSTIGEELASNFKAINQLRKFHIIAMT